MNRMTRVALVSTAALSLVAGATPTQAYTTGAGVVAFLGTATVAPGLSTPGVPALLGGLGGPDGTWTLATITAAGAAVAEPPLPGLPTPYVGAATIGATGALHVGLVHVFGPGAFCGLSGGSDGVGAIVIDGSPVVPIRDVGWLQSAATVIVYTGDTTFNDNGAVRVGGALAGVVTAIPPIPNVIGTGSCLAGTATQFTVVGVGEATFTTNP